MVFIPAETHPDVFRDALTDWEAWRDGAPPGPAPHTLQQEVDTFACEILEDFRSKEGYRIEYKKGMQGQYVREGNNPQGMRMALIYIPGVTEHGPEPGQSSKWVPYGKIKIGPKWPSRIDERDVRLPRMSAQLTISPPTLADDGDVLSATITNLIQAFVDNPTLFPRREFSKLVSSHGTEGLSRTILDGIREAGIYDVLSSSESTYQEFLDAARYKIDDNEGSGNAGVYVRFQRSMSEVEYWKPNTSFVYVGKTETDFASSYRSHRSGTHAYAHLSRASVDLVSFALCILGGHTEKAMYFLAKQVILCLMGTYRSEITRLAITNHRFENSSGLFGSTMANASYYLGVSGEVFRSTGYVPVLSRPTFGASEGANISSPMEQAEQVDGTNFMRTNFIARHHDTAESVSMAEFRSDRPVSAHWKKATHDDRVEFNLLAVPAQSGSKLRHIYKFTMSAVADDIDGIAYPANNTPCQIVIEVRLDGKVHKHAWARLPGVAIWKGWEQANSFAVRVEWELPDGSGLWRFRYVQSEELYQQVDPQIPGSLSRFAIATSVLSWLFQAELDGFPTWITKPSSSIRVLQVDVDYMSQSIQFIAPTKRSLELVVRHSASDIARQMTELGADGKKEDCESACNRNTCDLCYFLLSEIGLTTPVSCEKEGDGDLCTKCRKWGLPFCPRTSARHDGYKTTLYAMKSSDIGLKTFRQERLALLKVESIMEDDSGEEN